MMERHCIVFQLSNLQPKFSSLTIRNLTYHCTEQGALRDGNTSEPGRSAGGNELENAIKQIREILHLKFQNADNCYNGPSISHE